MAEKSPGCTGQPGRRSAEVFLPEGDALHLKAAAPEVIQQAGVRGEVEGQAVGVQGLPGLAVAAVHLPVAILAVPQQGAAQVRHGGTDLVGAARQQLHLQQGQLPTVLQRPVAGNGGLAAGNGPVVYGHLLFLLVLQQEAGYLPLRGSWRPHGDAEVALVDLPIPDLLVDDPQGLGVFGGDDDAAGVAVDAVAQRRGEGVLPPGVPLPLLVEVCLNVVDEGVDLLRLVGVDHQTGALVQQHQILVLVDDIQAGAEQGEEQIILPGLVEELVVDV